MSNIASDTIKVAGVIGDSITDGPGIRMTVFVQGCPHHCPGCHNPETHPFEGGQPRTAQELLEKLDKNPLLSGVTLSGGEPFCQAAALLPLAEGVRARGLELAAYSGWTYEQLLAQGGDAENLLRLCHVLVDGPFVLAERSLSLRFRGSKNQRIIDVQRSLAEGRAVLMQDGRWQ